MQKLAATIYVAKGDQVVIQTDDDMIVLAPETSRQVLAALNGSIASVATAVATQSQVSGAKVRTPSYDRSLRQHWPNSPHRNVAFTDMLVLVAASECPQEFTTSEVKFKVLELAMPLAPTTVTPCLARLRKLKLIEAVFSAAKPAIVAGFTNRLTNAGTQLVLDYLQQKAKLDAR